MDLLHINKFSQYLVHDLLDFAMHLFPRSRISNCYYSVWMVKNFSPVWIMLFYVFFCNIVKVKHFWYCFIILLSSMSSSLHTRSLLVPCAYISIESIDYILLLLISSIKKLLFQSLNVCCVLNIL